MYKLSLFAPISYVEIKLSVYSFGFSCLYYFLLIYHLITSSFIKPNSWENQRKRQTEDSLSLCSCVTNWLPQAGSPGVSPPPSHPPGLRCPTCDKQFSVPSILERHMRTHTQERPHTCSLCGRGYSQSGNLNVHLKTVHGIQVDGGRARCDPEASRPHKCYICNRLFTTSSNMYQHIRVCRSPASTI